MRYLMALGVLLATAATASERPLMEPAAAIAVADGASLHGVKGRFAMTVVTTDATPKGVFLNSTSDYRGADDLTLAIKPIVADELTKRFGQRPEAYLKGRRVVVDGVVRRRLIVNMQYGRPRSANRFQHEVAIDHPNQIVAVE